ATVIAETNLFELEIAGVASRKASFGTISTNLSTNFIRLGVGRPVIGSGVALHVANTGAMGSAQIRLDTQPADQQWDFAIDSNPETYYLGVRKGSAYAMVWELGGNVGIGTTNPGAKLHLAGPPGNVADFLR